MSDNKAPHSTRLDIIIRGRIELHFRDDDSAQDSDDLEIYDDWAEPEQPSSNA